MGQAKRRAAEIATQKALHSPRVEFATHEVFAVHECGHALADFHFNIAIGLRGIYVRFEQWGDQPESRPPSLHGFCDDRPLENWKGDNPEHIFCYRMLCLAGPMAELLFKQRLKQVTEPYLSNLPDFWKNDFKEMGATPQQFLAMHLGIEAEPAWANERTKLYFQRLRSATEELVRAYAGEITELSQMILRDPQHQVSKSDLDSWFSGKMRRALSPLPSREEATLE